MRLKVMEIKDQNTLMIDSPLSQSEAESGSVPPNQNSRCEEKVG